MGTLPPEAGRTNVAFSWHASVVKLYRADGVAVNIGGVEIQSDCVLSGCLVSFWVARDVKMSEGDKYEHDIYDINQ